MVKAKDSPHRDVNEVIEAALQSVQRVKEDQQEIVLAGMREVRRELEGPAVAMLGRELPEDFAGFVEVLGGSEETRELVTPQVLELCRFYAALANGAAHGDKENGKRKGKGRSENGDGKGKDREGAWTEAKMKERTSSILSFGKDCGVEGFSGPQVCDKFKLSRNQAGTVLRRLIGMGKISKTGAKVGPSVRYVYAD